MSVVSSDCADAAKSHLIVIGTSHDGIDVMSHFHTPIYCVQHVNKIGEKYSSSIFFRHPDMAFAEVMDKSEIQHMAAVADVMPKSAIDQIKLDYNMIIEEIAMQCAKLTNYNDKLSATDSTSYED